MSCRTLAGITTVVASLAVGTADCRSQAQPQYDNFKGQWVRIAAGFGAGQWDPSKPRGLRQEAPLTPEYQARYEANIKAMTQGGQEYSLATACRPQGMPRMMIAYEPMEMVVTPETTYVIMEYMDPLRRIYTDARDWPKRIVPTFAGYSIGKWEDTNGDGRLDTLVVETRGMKGPRQLDSEGLPLHDDNQTVIRERIFLDKSKPDLLHDEITTIDSAFTRPWTVTRSYRRARETRWHEYHCQEGNNHVVINNESYFLSGDGSLMPTRDGQAPPDLKSMDFKHFDRTPKQ